MIGWNISPQKALILKVYNIWLWQRSMKDEERAHHDAHFQEELDSLKVSMICITSMLEQTFKNVSNDGPSNRFMTFTAIQPEEIMGG